MTHAQRLEMLNFEERTVPALTGITWSNPNVTVSFVPDGANVGGVGSNLFESLGSQMSTSQWQDLVKSAFQSWVETVNLNFSIVSDDGRDLGSPGPMQGSPFVGDIRISARPLSDNVLAITNPPDYVSTWSGDIVLNSTKLNNLGNSAGIANLTKVLMHETGHALGLADSSDPHSVMVSTGGNINLDSNDYSSIQALYGVRTPDRFDASNSNSTFSTASSINYISRISDLNGSDGAQAGPLFVVQGDLTTANDVDVYQVSVPGNSTNPSIVVQTGNLSSVQLKVSVFKQTSGSSGGSFSYVSSTSTPDANGNYLIPLSSSSNDVTYFVRVQASSYTGKYDIGSYLLATGSNLTTIPQGSYSAKIATPNGVVTTTTSNTNTSLSSATKLGVASNSTDARWDFHGTATFNSASDVDYYQIQSSKQTSNSMIVSVGTAVAGVNPWVTVYDAQGRQLPVQLLSRNDNSMTVQLLNVTNETVYYVAVRSAKTSPTGNNPYQIGIDFRNAPVVVNSFVSGTLTQNSSQAMGTIQVTRSQLFHLQLSVSDKKDTVPTAARVTLFDSNNQVVYTAVAMNNRTIMQDILLAPGIYTVVIAGATKDGSPLLGLTINLQLEAMADPIGPALAQPYSTDSTSTSSGTTTTSPTTSPTSSGTTSDGYSITTTPTLGGFLAPTNPYSSPWW